LLINDVEETEMENMKSEIYFADIICFSLILKQIRGRRVGF
jgi:hypothetical protein